MVMREVGLCTQLFESDMAYEWAVANYPRKSAFAAEERFVVVGEQEFLMRRALLVGVFKIIDIVIVSRYVQLQEVHVVQVRM